MRKLLLFGLLILIQACAVQSSPDGGSKDETPPAIVEVDPPNQSLHFKSTEIEIEFDEYVKIEGFTTQFISSPPLKNKVEYSLRGKTLTLELDDTLRPNTTYTFSFGNAIKDITENNPQTDFKYVFSTGAVLDSQQVSGVVRDAFTTLPLKDVMIAMYDAESEDSVFMKEVPLYYGLSDENGNYLIENIAPGPYKIFAIKDADFNYLWSGNSEMIGFVEGHIHSEVNPVVDFALFRSPTAYKFYRGKFSSFGKIEAYFSIPATEVHFERLDTIGSTELFEYPENGDTIVMWTDTWRNGENGIWRVHHDPTASIDTMEVKFYEKDTARFRMKMFNNPPYSPADSIVLESSTPIRSIDTARFSVFKNDSIPVDFATELTSPRHIRLYVDLEYNDKVTWVIDSGAVEDLFRRHNDSSAQNFKIKQDNELSVLHFKVSSDSATSKLLQLYDEDGKVVYEVSFTSQVNVDLFDIHPQKYNARVIYDRNGNKKWDSGDFFARRQPEKVIYLEKQIELRANWEIDETWIIP